MSAFANWPSRARLTQFAHSFQGRYGAYPGDKGVEIGVRHFAEIFLARHGTGG